MEWKMEQKQIEKPAVLTDFILEGELCELFGISKGSLSHLRTSLRLPYCKINDRCRVYYESDVREWLLSRKRIIEPLKHPKKPMIEPETMQESSEI